MREVKKRYAEMYICSGLDVLEGPYRLDISRVPFSACRAGKSP
jgi:hypothetical protein